VPSLSALNSIRASSPAHSARRTVAIYADPVFSSSDPRLEQIANNNTSASIALVDRVANARFSEEMELNRLPGTRIEAETIAAYLEGEDVLIATAFDASRSNLLREDLNRFRILHFATHGEVNAQYPALSKLFLSNFRKDGTYASGTLLLNDIYNLDLSADLVVLSACDTALGQAIRGEGLIGFTQGFLYAGARSVAVSLWQVPDRPTGDLMRRFYEQVLDDTRRVRYSAALRQAQLSIRAERRWRNPYFWAAFLLIGDWQ
jgi:CHAT domain-containing protein